MEKYTPKTAPDPQEWLALDEQERIDMIREFHENKGLDLEEDAMNMHALIHVVVENQLAEQVKYVPETLSRLTRQGLSRHEAVHAIGTVVAGDIFDILKHNKAFSASRYRLKLSKLTAKRWKKGKY